MSTKMAKSNTTGFFAPEPHSQGEGFSRKKAGMKPPYIDPGKQFLDQISRLPKMLPMLPPVAAKFERKLEPNWCKMCNKILPFADLQPTYNDPIVISPWLKFGDVVLVTGYNRNCGFIEKLGDSLFAQENFFGNGNPYMPMDRVGALDERLSQSAWHAQIGIISALSLDLRLPSDKKKFGDIVRSIKNARNVLICSFNVDYDFLRDMSCWDSVIEIRRGKKIESSNGRYSVSNVKFLRARHLPENLKQLTYKMIIHIPDGVTGYDAKKNIYFVNDDTGYEELRECIVQLFKLGRTAYEIKKTLETENKIIISLPTLNRLKREWGLRRYRPEKNQRKKKSPRNQSDESSSSDAQI